MTAEDQVLRVEYRDAKRGSLRLKATKFERDPEQPGWIQFRGPDDQVLKSRVNAADVLQIVDEGEEAEYSFGIA